MAWFIVPFYYNPYLCESHQFEVSLHFWRIWSTVWGFVSKIHQHTAPLNRCPLEFINRIFLTLPALLYYRLLSTFDEIWPSFLPSKLRTYLMNRILSHFLIFYLIQARHSKVGWDFDRSVNPMATCPSNFQIFQRPCFIKKPKSKSKI